MNVVNIQDWFIVHAWPSMGNSYSHKCKAAVQIALTAFSSKLAGILKTHI